MTWSIQGLTDRIRRLGATEAHQQQQSQNNVKTVSKQETLSEAEGRPEQAGEECLNEQGGSTAVLPAGIEDVFCATAATTNRPQLRRCRTLGSEDVSRRARDNGSIRRAAADCATGDTTELPGQPSTPPPLRRATSDSNIAAQNGATTNTRARTKQRGELVEPSAVSMPSTLPVIRRVASRVDTLRRDSNSKPDRRPPSAAALAAEDMMWPVLPAQEIGGMKSERAKMRRRNSLPILPRPPEALAGVAARSGIRDRDNRGTEENRPPAVVGDNGPIVREEINRAEVRAPTPRPTSLNLGVRTSSFSSVHYYGALQAQEEIDREQAKIRPGRREDRNGGNGTASAGCGPSKEPRQRQTSHRSRSPHQTKKTPRKEEKKKEEPKTHPRREGKRPSTALAPDELRRSSPLGSSPLLLPVSPRFYDADDEDHRQQQRRKRRGRRRQRDSHKIVAAAEGQRNEERVDIRAISADRGVDGSPSTGKTIATPSSSARSEHWGRRRPRSLEREDREKAKQRAAAPPAETAADGAAASATPAAAAAVRAVAAAHEVKEAAEGRVASPPDAGAAAAAAAAAAIVTAGAHRRARQLVAEPPTAETQLVAAAAADGTTSPLAFSSVWVTRYMDLSSTYGLLFLLSDGSVGALFKDNTKMVVDLAGEAIDYIEPPPGSRTAAPGPLPTSSIHKAESEGGRRPHDDAPDGNNTSGSINRTGGQNCYYRYTLGSFPFYLRKKVRILKYAWKNLYLDYCSSELEGYGSKVRTAPQHGRREPLTFIDKWQRAGDTHCFQLSHQVAQVVFSDGTEVLLSKDRQVITFVGDDGKREIQPRRNMENRTEVMKRIRCAEDFVFLMLESP